MNPHSVKLAHVGAFAGRRQRAQSCVVVRALILAAIFVLSPFALSPAFAFSPSEPLTGPTPLVAGNYCVSCHDTADPRLAQASDWRGSPAVTPSACPGLHATDEQLYYVERELLGLTRLDPNSPSLASLYEAYGALLDAPRDSTDAFAAQAQLVAYKAGKAYATANQGLENGKRLRVQAAALLVTAFLLFALAWGLRHTLRYQPTSRFLKTYRPGPRTVGALGMVIVLFALPLFRTAPPTVATSTVEEQAVQAELDKSSRAGAVAERALGRAWMLGQIAATWAKVDPARGEAILGEALAAEDAARGGADALWGRSQAGREAGIGSAAGQDKAVLVSEELLSVRNRAWALRLIASEWAAVDLVRAREILARAEAVARANPSVYGQIDLAAIAAAWARLDPARTVDAPAPVLSGVALGAAENVSEVLALYQAQDYARAWEASSRIADEWERARAQSAIAVAWGNAEAAGQVRIPPLRDHAIKAIEGSGNLDPEDPALFDRALKMAAAARVRGDPLAPARASLALARALIEKGAGQQQIEAALSQAYDLTIRISVKYK